MRAFEFLEAGSVGEASAMLEKNGEDARPLAGGTSLVLLLRQRLAEPSHVVHIGNIVELRGVRVDGEGALHIGALTTHAEVASHPLIRERFPVVSKMASQVANPQVRNVATLGGNLCHGDPASDPPTCLVALEARVRLQKGRSVREMPLEQFLKGYYENALEPSEVLLEVIVPSVDRAVTNYSRFITNPAEGRPLVTTALRAVREASGLWTEVRLVLGALVPAPLRAVKAEAFLVNRALAKDVLAQAADLAVQDLEPIDDFRASGPYRRDVARVIVRRLLEECL